MTTRRTFHKMMLAGMGATALTSRFSFPCRADTKPINELLPFQRGTYESTLLKMDGDRVMMINDYGHKLQRLDSTDRGATWTSPEALKTASGDTMFGYRTSVLRLKSGRIGLVHTGKHARPGRDGSLIFRTSDDEGKTWSEGVAVDPHFAVSRNNTARVLKSGRVIIPTFKWISAYAGGISEAAGRGMSYSWTYFSDDEGRSWKSSHSELVVSVDDGKGGRYDFEEPVLEELADGRLLMIGRTELGRPYKSYSTDEGSSWSWPEPMPVASAYAPTDLRRIPGTGDLLMTWNQCTPLEIESGLSRHRLTCAISSDDGMTWGHFKNLESLDDRSQIDPPPESPVRVYRTQPLRNPMDKEKYPHAPGPVRVCYPSFAFWEDRVLVVYDGDDASEYQLGSKQANRFNTLQQSLPMQWFFS